MSKPQPQAQPGILDIAPYVPGKSETTIGGPVIKLSSNENPFGASPAAVEAFAQCAAKLHLYPDGAATELRRAIAARHGMAMEQIVCGAGSDELLGLLAQAYLGPGDEAIYTRHGFLVYPIVIRANGARPVIAEESNLTADVDAILDKITPRTKMVFLANPNNPTGTFLPASELARLQAGLPPHVLLVIDAAYAEYVTAKDYEPGTKLVAAHGNVVMTRTFSKIYGLAALRIGWAYCPPPIADVLDRIRGPFNLSSAAIAAGSAAMQDQAHVEEARAHNETWRQWASGELRALGLEVTPSAGNFILIHFPETPEANAAAADLHLQKHGIVLRRMEAYHLPHALRMTIGSGEECLAVIAALKDFFKGQQPGARMRAPENESTNS